MRLFKCRHDWEIAKRSNVLQLDEMGYPLRLCIVRCKKCGKSDQQWLDTSVSALEDVKIGKAVLLSWEFDKQDLGIWGINNENV